MNALKILILFVVMAFAGCSDKHNSPASLRGTWVNVLDNRDGIEITDTSIVRNGVARKAHFELTSAQADGAIIARFNESEKDVFWHKENDQISVNGVLYKKGEVLHETH